MMNADPARADAPNEPLPFDPPPTPEGFDEAPAQSTHGAVTIAEPLMTKDEFYQAMFSPPFIIAGGMSNLRSLSDAPELPTARPASDAIYDICARISWLNILLARDGQFVGQMAIIAAFGFQLRQSVNAELAEKRKELEAKGEGGQ